MTRQSALLNHLQKDDFNFEHDASYGTVTVYMKRGYISVSDKTSWKAFMDIFTEYIKGHDYPGIVWTSPKLSASTL